MRSFVLSVIAIILCFFWAVDVCPERNYAPASSLDSNIVTGLSRKDALKKFGLPKEMSSNIWHYDKPYDFIVKFDTPPAIANVLLIPYRYVVNVGFPFEIKAFLVYEDSTVEELPSNIEWHITNKTIVTRKGNVFIPIKEGHTNIFAICNGVVSTPCEVYVQRKKVIKKGKELQRIRIFPEQPMVTQNTTLRFLALGVFYDYSKREAEIEDISDDARWFVVRGEKEKEVGNEYIYFGEDAVDRVFCRYDGVKSNVEKVTKIKDNKLLRNNIKFIRIFPSVFFVEEGETIPFRAIATYYDNRVEDITSLVDWNVSNRAIAEFVHKGILRLKKEGIVKVKGKFGAIESLSAKIVVSQKALNKNNFFSSYRFLYKDEKKYYKREYHPGRYRTKVSVEEGKVIVAPYDEEGIKRKKIEVLSKGETTTQEAYYRIKETMGAIKEILPQGGVGLEYILLDPPYKNMSVGEKSDFKATAVYKDGHRSDITLFGEWKCSPVGKASIDKGEVTALEEGKVYIWVVFNNRKSSKAEVQIAPPKLTSIYLDKYNIVMPWKKYFFIKAEGYYSDGTKRDVTSMVKWYTDSSDIINTIKPGVFRGIKKGKARIYCGYNNIKSLPTKVTIFIPLREIVLYFLFSIFILTSTVVAIFYLITVRRAKKLRGLCMNDSRRFVIELYEHMKKILGIFGFRCKHSYTPFILAEKIDSAFSIGEGVFKYIATIFSKAAYSRHEISKEEASRFLESYNKGVENIKKKVRYVFLRILIALFCRLPLHI